MDVPIVQNVIGQCVWCNMQHIFDKIKDERDYQDAKWGENRNLEDTYWLSILVEEVGEAAKAILQVTPNLEEELIQIMAVAVAWLENIERNEQE